MNDNIHLEKCMADFTSSKTSLGVNRPDGHDYIKLVYFPKRPNERCGHPLVISRPHLKTGAFWARFSKKLKILTLVKEWRQFVFKALRKIDNLLSDLGPSRSNRSGMFDGCTHIYVCQASEVENFPLLFPRWPINEWIVVCRPCSVASCPRKHTGCTTWNQGIYIVNCKHLMICTYVQILWCIFWIKWVANILLRAFWILLICCKYRKKHWILWSGTLAIEIMISNEGF